MAEQRYEYQVEPVFLSPDELRNDRFSLEDTLNEYAGDGWRLDEVLRIDGSSFAFVFARPVES
jgi:hypothetical protein